MEDQQNQHDAPPSNYTPPTDYQHPPPTYQTAQPTYQNPPTTYPSQPQQPGQPIIVNNTVQQQQQQQPGGGVVIVNQVQPSDCLVCSILNCIFCNVVFGVIAIIFSCLARDSFERGALEEGRGRAKVAKAMNIVGPIITVLTVVITVIYVVVVIGSLFF